MSFLQRHFAYLLHHDHDSLMSYSYNTIQVCSKSCSFCHITTGCQNVALLNSLIWIFLPVLSDGKGLVTATGARPQVHSELGERRRDESRRVLGPASGYHQLGFHQQLLHLRSHRQRTTLRKVNYYLDILELDIIIVNFTPITNFYHNICYRFHSISFVLKC